MKWSWRIGRFAGIPVYMHATFLLLVAWIAWMHLRAGDTLTGTLAGIGFVLSIFVCVVLHEYGHALTARHFGVRTRDIVLLPIGGVARLERMPENPRHELWVAVAGPAVNVVIAAVLYGGLRVTGQWQALDALGPASGSFLERLLLVNVFLVVFNLIPAFPMDGGRVLRALLALRTDHARATRIAAGIGQALAFVFGFVGLFGNPFLVFIALFVWIGAAAEASQAQTRDALGGIPLRQVMLTDFRVLAPEDTLARAVQLTLAGSQADFPVVSDDTVRGVLTQGALVRGLEEAGRDGRVADFMIRDFETARADELALPVFHRLQKCGCRTIPVLRDGRLHGLVTTDNMGEFLRIRSALQD